MPDDQKPSDAGGAGDGAAIREMLDAAGRLERAAADRAEALAAEPELRHAIERLRVAAAHARARHGLN
jgi:hypothetical protein